jgi:hypothetical protein
VFLPSFFRQRDQFGVLELKLDVGEIVVKASTSQALHVLEDEGPRPGFSYGSNGLGEHIPRIIIGPMAPTEGERLTWRSTRDEVDFAFIDGKINVPDIAFDDVPIPTVP